jgi:UDP-3-O-[3-hydroxymyristoyl] N-acetylglucosamine deacetylase
VLNETETTGHDMTDITLTSTGSSVRQHTVAQAVSWTGPARKGQAPIQLHIHPGEVDSGIWFLRTDLDAERRVIAARWDTVVESRAVITLANREGVLLRGATTLLAALRVCGIDNALIEIDGPEVPSRSHDFESYLDLLVRAGTQRQSLPRKALRIQQAIEVRDSAGIATLVPALDFRVQLIVPRTDADPTAVLLDATLASNLTEPAAPEQRNELPPGAMTVPLRDVMQLPFALRARLINVLGHLSLTGAPLIGHFTGYRSGNALHHTLVRALMTRVTATYLTVDQHRTGTGAPLAHDDARPGDLPRRPDGKLH